MKCLVTGGAGFIGSHLVRRLLDQKHDVTVIDNLSLGKKDYLKECLKHPRFQFFKLDLLESNKLTKIFKSKEMIFHLAANSDIRRAVGNPALDFQQGIQATFNVLEAMRTGRAAKLVYFSGSGVYGDCGARWMSEGQGELYPESMYGAAKLSSEAMISSYAHLYGLQAWVFRPANIIGGRMTHGVIFDFVRKLKENSKKLLVLGDGTQSKSYVHVDDVLAGIFCALKKGKQSFNVFNIASDTYISVKSIADIVIREMKLKHVRLKLGRSQRGWKGDIPKYRLDTQRLKTLGWKPELSSRQAVIRATRQILQETSS